MTKEQQPIFDDNLNIDRDSFEPAYIQLANILRHQIAEGLFRVGDQLPSESQLCHRYGISPMTVRRTINLLADEGIISTVQGRGTFVKSIELSEATFDLQELKDLFKKDQSGNIKLLDARVVSANDRIGRKLDIPFGSAVIYIRRLFSRENTPVFYHRAYLVYDPTRPIVEAEMDVTSLQGLFAGSNNSILKYGQLNIEATLLTSEEAELLKRPRPQAAFYLEHLFYDYDDRPISWGFFIIPSNRLHFTAQVGLSHSDSIQSRGK